MRNRGSTPEEGDREIAGFSEFGQDHIEIREVLKSVGNTLGKHFFVSRHSTLIGGFGYDLLFFTDQVFLEFQQTSIALQNHSALRRLARMGPSST